MTTDVPVRPAGMPAAVCLRKPSAVRENRGMPSQSQDTPTVDVLGHPYRVETIELPDDDEGPVVATLVCRDADETTGQPTGKAVLHVHGFADYFFQTPAADYWTARGY